MDPVKDRYPHYIEFRHVYKTFDYPVLVDCNFYVSPGETLAIIGRSGVGKSVSLGHVMGFLKPDSGRVIVAHQDITDYSEAELRLIRRKVTMTALEVRSAMTERRRRSRVMSCARRCALERLSQRNLISRPRASESTLPPIPHNHGAA